MFKQMTSQERETFVTKWVYRFGRFCIVALILYHASVLAAAYAQDDALG